MPSSINRVAFEKLGADIKEARQALQLSRKTFAEMANIDPRYLANIENSGSIPSLPLLYELAQILKLPIEKYFYPNGANKDSEQRNRVKIKLDLCPEKYLSFVEGVLDNAIQLDEKEAEHD